MASTGDASSTTKSGICRLDTGESVVPSSVRADGSVRKQIRVKPGYTPPEDVGVYKNRTAEAWKNRGKGGVPGADPVNGEQLRAAAGKNAKRREARKKAATAAGGADNTLNDTATNTAKSDVPTAVANNGTVASNDEVDPDAENAKEAKKLTKRLRQARELQAKKERREGLLPEQILKISRISEIIRQLEELGYDEDGEKRNDETDNGEQKVDSESSVKTGEKTSTEQAAG